MNNKNKSGLGNDNTNFIQPEFIRVKGVEKMFGIKAGTVYQLIRNGMIDSKLLRNRGTIRGIRLISVDSVRDYINSQQQ